MCHRSSSETSCSSETSSSAPPNLPQTHPHLNQLFSGRGGPRRCTAAVDPVGDGRAEELLKELGLQLANLHSIQAEWR